MIAVFLFFPHVSNAAINKTSDFRAFEEFDIKVCMAGIFGQSKVLRPSSEPSSSLQLSALYSLLSFLISSSLTASPTILHESFLE